MSILKIYYGNPTAGGTDGTAASEGTQTSPITATLVVTPSAGADQSIACAARCDAGYQTTGDTTLKFVDSGGNDYTGDNYKLSLNGTTWSSSVTISNSIGDTNMLFYVKLAAPAAATPINDTSIKLYHAETVKAVA